MAANQLPQYKKLYETLRKQILEGVFKEGDLLPSENELSLLHGMTRPTVRHALDTLVNEGYIYKHQGKGSIVNAKPREIGILSIEGITSAIGPENLKTKIIIKPNVRPWPENFMFDIPGEIKNLGCIYLERLRMVNDQAIFYDINYIPNLNLPRFTSRKFENKSLFDILRVNYNIEIKGGEQKLRAIGANQLISRYFKIKKGHPVLHLERKLDTNRHGFNIYSSFFCNTENYSLTGIF